MLPGGIPGISSGGGSIAPSFGGGTSGADGGQAGGAGGQQFRFDTPASIQAADKFQWPVIAGLAVLGLYLWKSGK